MHDTLDDLSDLDLPDVRCASVIWNDSQPYPDVSFSGCSAYEAIGFLRVGAQKLEHDYALGVEDDDDD